MNGEIQKLKIFQKLSLGLSWQSYYMVKLDVQANIT